MAMESPIEPVLQPVPIRKLRPTQMTVGMREVKRKREQWRERSEADGGEFLGRHMLPVVIGPGKSWWLIDHHHLARALYDEGVEHVLVSVIADLSHLPKRRFFPFLDCRNWLHPYDGKGTRREWEDLPRHVGRLADDPYRALAGEARRAGGFAKTQTPYSEFLWADFLRDRVDGKTVEHKFGKAVDKALVAVRSEQARHLPGYSGPD